MLLSLSVFFNDTATTEIYTLSLHDALPISSSARRGCCSPRSSASYVAPAWPSPAVAAAGLVGGPYQPGPEDRKSTRLNSSHANISYAVFCLKKKKNSIVIHLNCTNKSLLIC